MDLKVTTLEGKAAGSVTLNKDIFGLEPRSDLIQRCVVWQLAKRRAGTHKVKNRAEINRTGKKSVAQKGSGADGRSVRIRATIRSICRRRCGRSRCATPFPPRRKTAT
jgi:ribosomal protein L4